MKSHPLPTDRSDTQAERIILNRILSGEFHEGMRLPNTAELANELNIGANSVQQALARLSSLGYLERKPRLGTFVRRQPEVKEANVMVLVGPNLKQEAHYMDRRLTICLENELIEAGYIPHVFDNLISAQNPDFPGRVRTISKLIRDFTMYNPLGVIESTFTLKRFLELASEFDRPSVSIKSPTLGGDINGNHTAFVRESLRYLAKAGRKRVLWVLKVAGKLQESRRFDEFWAELRSAGMECAKILEINDQDTKQNPELVACERIKDFIRQNRTLPATKRADCILVDEDILMRGVSMGLLAEQVKIPEEFLPCTITNESIDLHYGLPVIRYENPLSQIAREAVSLLKTRILRDREPRLPILVPGKIIEALPLETLTQKRSIWEHVPPEARPVS